MFLKDVYLIISLNLTLWFITNINQRVPFCRYFKMRMEKILIFLGLLESMECS
jgi:hypothetical protein